MFPAARATARASAHVLRITILVTLIASAAIVLVALGQAAYGVATGDLPTPTAATGPCASYGAVACTP